MSKIFQSIFNKFRYQKSDSFIPKKKYKLNEHGQVIFNHVVPVKK